MGSFHASILVWACLAPVAGAQDSPWSSAEGPFEDRRDIAVVERPGSELRADGDRILRRRNGSEAALACTDPAGTGAIRDLALDPAGLVFVAAERGLFVVSAEVDALDPVKLAEGAPKGIPRSVFVDARRRLWIATEQEIGVVDPSFGWGRTMSLEDGLPGGPPYRLAGEPDDTLLVETSSGVFRYRPDQGPAPVVTRIEVDGKTFEPGETVTGVYGKTIFVAAEGRAQGGASFRRRLDRHHVWREFGVEPIEDIHPGQHVLEVIAIDRDLRRSAPATIPISFDLPPQYEKAFVLKIGVILVALVTALFAWRARRSGGGRAAWIRAPISAAIAIAIGVQVLAGIVPHAKGWPFMGFSMYTNTYGENWVIYDGGVFGIEPGGTTRKLQYHGVVAFADDRWQVIGPIIDGGPGFSREWVERYNALHPSEEIVGLQARADRRRLTAEGPVEIAPLVFSSWRAPEGTDGRR
ncbi:MAG: hypothetical protein ACKVXR_16175 [Planctomycetota bacterium]